jgi:hypothetical protein
LVPDILEKLEQYTKETGTKIDAVCSFVELATETAAKVAEAMKLPCSPSKSVSAGKLTPLPCLLECMHSCFVTYFIPDQVAIARSKPATRDCVEAAGLPKVTHCTLSKRLGIQRRLAIPQLTSRQLTACYPTTYTADARHL